MYINVTKGGIPVRDALVAVWKAGKYGDEVFNNRYFDSAGKASIPVSVKTAGTLYYSVRDRSGNTAVGSILMK